MHSLKLETRDFGKIEVNEEDVLNFTSGMYGFEEFKKFVILKENPDDDIMFLQSIENTDLSFVLIDPYSILRSYEPSLNEEDLCELNVKKESDLKYLVIAIIKENIKDSVANLKSPIAINPDSRSAKQVILQNSYPLRYNIISPEEDGKC